MSFTSPGDTAIIRRFDPATGTEGERLPVIGEITYSRALQDNFFVLCMTGEYDSRHLDDFGGDALLIVENVRRFSTRLEKAVRKVRPGLKMISSPVSYYDPYFARPDSLLPQISKHFRFAYQKEFRFLWIQQGLSLSEKPLFIEMGTLRDIARLHLLPRG